MNGRERREEEGKIAMGWDGMGWRYIHIHRHIHIQQHTHNKQTYDLACLRRGGEGGEKQTTNN